MYVKWRSTLSSKFQVTNGVRQGGVIYPLLFNVYVNELSELLNKSGIGGNMGGTIISSASTSYNSVLRRLLCISKPYNARNMFVSRGIPSFAELLRKSIYRFKNRI